MSGLPSAHDPSIRADDDGKHAMAVFPRSVTSVGAARHWLAGYLARHRVDSATAADAGLVLSELVTNALRHGLGDPRNTILFVGFQAEHTLGRRILEGRPEVKVFGEMHEVRSEVAHLNGLSAHADRGGIAEWLGRVRGTRRVFLVHGDEERCEALRGWLRGSPGGVKG